jgi:hypothetical protein
LETLPITASVCEDCGVALNRPNSREVHHVIGGSPGVNRFCVRMPLCSQIDYIEYCQGYHNAPVHTT